MSGYRRTKNAIKDSELPKKRALPETSTQPTIVRLKERARPEEKPTQSDFEDAQLLIGAAAGSIPEEQQSIVYLVNEDAGVSTQVISDQPEQGKDLSEEELRELQALLDSQLLDQKPDDDDSRHLIKNREQLDTAPEQDEDAVFGYEPNKGFTSVEIQAFQGHQIKRQQKLQSMDDQFEPLTNRTLQQPQQHLILLTQNGDKIILIQNPNEMEEGDGDLGADYQIPELTEEQERILQEHHRHRQQCFVMRLERLRELHQTRLPPSVTTPAVPHMQPIELIPYPGKSEKDEDIDDDELWTPSSSKSRSRAKKAAITPSRKPAGDFPKWFKPIGDYLELAVKYVKRREEKIDDVAKLFPLASANFEKRCQDLKKDFLNIESAIERFQTTIGRDLEEASGKFQSFLKDFHLDGSIGEMEEEELEDFNAPNLELEAKGQPQLRRVKKITVTPDSAPNNVHGNISNASGTSCVGNTNHDDSHKNEDDPFEFKQESDVSVTPVPLKNISLSTPVIMSDKTDGNDSGSPSRPVRSARLQRKRPAEVEELEPVRPPSRRKAKGSRR